MTGSTPAKVVEDQWTSLAAEQVTGERRLRVAPLPVQTANGSLATAIDFDGHRHLLVPMRGRQQLRRGLDGPVLRLRRRPLEDADSYQVYADLGCLQPAYDELFTRLCADVLVEVGRIPENPLKALYRVLDRWQALFQSRGLPLDLERLAGLFGELSVLNRLLEQDPSAHRLWRGPGGSRHDFVGPVGAIEVKASTASEGRRPRIHGLDQLESPSDGGLQLVWLRLRRAAEGGVGLVELVERALELCDDENALLSLLAEVGYQAVDAEIYQALRFETTEERWYRVDAGFPKLTGQQLIEAGLPVDALNVEYTIDLSGDQPAPMGEDEVIDALHGMLVEHPV
ncbi:PD-(D/E)XK motif protein [Streptacidiphilus anmyonensis]|uniref:PD-(D/E)XK motif protein n=1 Tax=Streptacidiphilus anmyonensis TaxID=405782 RepID=UPI0005A6DE45|nr:PD-(D/E)XK motif protein [Streptacidiphilus anmyonensis]